MALAAKRRVVVNAGRGRTKRNRRKLSAKQVKYFGTPAQKAALRNSRSRRRNWSPFKKKVTASWKRTKKTGKRTPYGVIGFQRTNSSRARNTAQRSRSYLPRKHRARSKNPGEILSLVLNPGGTKKGKNMAAPRRRRKSSSASGRRSHRRRSVANPHHRRRRMSNPVHHRRRNRRNYGRRHNLRRNPSEGSFKSDMMLAVAAFGGFFGSKILTQMVMQSNNTGPVGYLGNAIATAGLAIVTAMFPPTKKLTTMVLAGGAIQIIARIVSDNTSVGQVLSSSGMGDYQMQNFVTPQRLVDPLGSAQIEIPTGWGSAAPIAIQTAAPPGAPAPAATSHPGVSGYNTQGFGSSMYSPQGLYS